MGEDVAQLFESHTMGAPDELGYVKEDTVHIPIYWASMGTQKCAPNLGYGFGDQNPCLSDVSDWNETSTHWRNKDFRKALPESIHFLLYVPSSKFCLPHTAGLCLFLWSLSEGRYYCAASCLPGSALNMPRLIKWVFLGWCLFLDCVVGWYAQIR